MERHDHGGAADGLDFHLDDRPAGQHLRGPPPDRPTPPADGRPGRHEGAAAAGLLRRGRDVADRAELAELGRRRRARRRRGAGRSSASDEGVADLREELMTGLERGVTAVPTFVFEGRWAVPGAQDADTMLVVLETVRGAARRRRPHRRAAACDDERLRRLPYSRRLERRHGPVALVAATATLAAPLGPHVHEPHARGPPPAPRRGGPRHAVDAVDVRASAGDVDTVGRSEQLLEALGASG